MRRGEEGTHVGGCAAGVPKGDDVNNYVEEARGLQDAIVADRRHLHQIPEVGMDLPETFAYVAGRLDEMGVEWRPCGVMREDLTEKYVEMGFPRMERSTGIVATIGDGAPCILLRADYDALPIEEENDLPFRSQRACSHLCGHDAHAAMLLAAARILKDHEEELPGTVKLMFQPGEELGYGARTMIEDGLLENPHVDAAFALHVMSTEPAGTVVYTPGVTSSSLDTFALRIQGRGGHTSAPQQCVDPLMVANQVYEAINLFMTREIAPGTPATLSCGVMKGGAASNVIPDSAEMHFGLRSRDVLARSHVLERIPEIVDAYVRAWRADYRLSVFNCPLAYSNEELLVSLMPALEAVAGPGGVKQGAPMPSTEDFGHVCEEVPSVLVLLGAGGPGRPPHHNPRMTIDEDVLWMGAAIHVCCAVRWLSLHAR